MRELHWTGQNVIKAAIDASGNADFGSVDSLITIEDRHKIPGDWGEIIVQSHAPSLSIDPPATTPAADLVRWAKRRWRIEHDYRELKQGLGLDHFEGCTWRGWHHHVTLVTAAPTSDRAWNDHPPTLPS